MERSCVDGMEVRWRGVVWMEGAMEMGCMDGGCDGEELCGWDGGCDGEGLCGYVRGWEWGSCDTCPASGPCDGVVRRILLPGEQPGRQHWQQPTCLHKHNLDGMRGRRRQQVVWSTAWSSLSDRGYPGGCRISNTAIFLSCVDDTSDILPGNSELPPNRQMNGCPRHPRPGAPPPPAGR
jgi:hypothetical protein